MTMIENLLSPLEQYPYAITILQLIALVLAVSVANLVTRRWLVRAIGRAARLTSSRWDDALLGHDVISRIAHVVPALAVNYGITFVSGLSESIVTIVRSVASAYVALTVALAIVALLNAFGRIYEERDPERARSRPIKGYLQLAKIVIYL